MLPPRLALLDPRLAIEAASAPILSAVNIPVSELDGRMHELPPKHEDVILAGSGPAIQQAMKLLEERERRVVVSSDWRYGAASAGRLWEPNAFLLQHLPVLGDGRALDLACGTGRDTVTLAASGWSVVAVDHLSDALVKGRDLARRYLSTEEAASIEWQQMDLEKEVPSGSFDLITMFFYLDRHLLAIATERLNPGGHLMVETFTRLHRETYNKPRREHIVLDSQELVDLLAGLEVLHYDEAWRYGRHTARGLFRAR